MSEFFNVTHVRDEAPFSIVRIYAAMSSYQPMVELQSRCP